MSLPTLEFDPYSYEQDEDPYPIFTRMRDEAPLYHNPRLDFYALTRFEDCLNAFLDWRTYSSARGTVLELMDSELARNAHHLHGPSAPNRPSQPRVESLHTPSHRRPRARNSQNRLPLPRRDQRRGECDIVADFTANLPMDVISTLLGIPEEDREQVRIWSNGVLHREPGNPAIPPVALEAMGQLLEYFNGACARDASAPRDDIMTLLTQAEIVGADGDRHRLSDEELRSFFNLLATAGNETVTKLLATAFYCLAEFPEERERLCKNPGLDPQRGRRNPAF